MPTTAEQENQTQTQQQSQKPYDPRAREVKEWERGLSDLERVKALMRRMGSRSGFDPVPPALTDWLSGHESPMIQMFWWMLKHTIRWGHRNEFAVASGTVQPRTVEDMAEDLGFDEANTRHYWRIGVAEGLWRNGTKAEGPRKLYLCGNVPRPKKQGEQEENGKVCTDLWPPYLLKQIQALTPERRADFQQRDVNRREARKLRFAALVAADREVDTQEEDTLLSEFGLRKIREEHKKREVDPEELAIRSELAQAVTPVIARYAQTYGQLVQTRNLVSTNSDSENAETSPTLLPQRTTREKPVKRAGVVSGEPRARPEKPLPEDGEKPFKQLPAVSMPELSGEEREAEDLAFCGLQQIQADYPHFDFSHTPLSRDMRGDVTTVRLILRVVSPAHVHGFLRFVREKFDALDRRALGAPPQRAKDHPHIPRKLGLILSYAHEYISRQTLTDQTLAREARRSAACREQELHTWRRVLDEPGSSEYERTMARLALGDLSNAELDALEASMKSPTSAGGAS